MQRQQYYQCLLSICFVLAFYLAAIANHIQPNSAHFFRNLKLQDGFPAQKINCIVSDKKQFIWIGTDEGLIKYDGNSFSTYQHIPGDSNSLLTNSINSLFIDSKNNLWIGSSNSLSLFNREQNNFFHIRSNSEVNYSIPEGFNPRIRQDIHGNLWLCSGGFDLTCLSTETTRIKSYRFTIGKTEKGIRPEYLRDFIIDKQGIIWIVSKRNIIQFNPTTKDCKITKVLSASSPGDPTLINCIQSDTSNSQFLWIGTWGSGLIRFDKQNGRQQQFMFETGKPKNLSNIIFAIEPADSTNIWLGTRGLVKFNTVSTDWFVESYSKDMIGSLVNNEVRTMHTDKNKRLWIGTADGVSMLDPSNQNFSFQTIPKKLDNYELLVDAKNKRVFAYTFYSNRSLFVLDENKQIKERYAIPFADKAFSEPTCMLLDSNEQIWIGTTKTGLWVFDLKAKQFRQFGNNSKKEGWLPEMIIRDLIFNPQNGRIILVSINQGIWEIDPLDSSLRPIESSLQWAEKIIHGANGDLWIMSEQEGIAWFNKASGSFESVNSYLSEKQRLLFKGINDFCADKQGNIWLSTKDQGVVILKSNLKRKSFELFTLNSSNGFPFNTSFEITYDNAGKIWLTSMSNLISIDASNGNWRNFNKDEGLPYNLSNSRFISPDTNEIWLCHSGGINKFSPSKLNTQKAAPEIYLASILVNGKSVFPSLSNSLLLKNYENSLSFDFPAIEYLHQNSLTYYYKLEGIENIWHSSDIRHTATYSDLPPGKYVFRVKVSSPNNLLAEYKLVNFEILPAWWQSWVFRVFLVLVTLFGIFFTGKAYAQRKLNIKLDKLENADKINQVRNRIARDIHDEIGAGLTKINLMSQQLQPQVTDSVIATDISFKIRHQSKEIIQNISEIIWSVNPENDTLAACIAYMRSYLNTYFENTSITHTFKVNQQELSVSGQLVRPEIKRNLIMIYKELLNNILKHSQATEIHVNLMILNDTMELNVIDNGKGYIANIDESEGNGMKNLVKRLTEMQGKLTKNNLKTGCEIHCVFKWRDSY